MSKYQLATRDEIISLDDSKESVVDIETWQRAVRVRSLSMGEALAIAKVAKNDEEQTMFTLVAGVVEPKFEKADIADLKQKNSAAIAEILAAINEVSGGTPSAKDDVDAAKDDFRS